MNEEMELLLLRGFYNSVMQMVDSIDRVVNYADLVNPVTRPEELIDSIVDPHARDAKNPDRCSRYAAECLTDPCPDCEISNISTDVVDE